jgi:hypothetical protein
MVNMGTNNSLSALAGFLGVCAEVSAHQRAYSFYSDVFKDVEGIRPRWAFHYSTEELERGVDELLAREEEYRHEDTCELCYHGETCRERMPTSGDGWSFTPAL